MSDPARSVRYRGSLPLLTLPLVAAVAWTATASWSVPGPASWNELTLTRGQTIASCSFGNWAGAAARGSFGHSADRGVSSSFGNFDPAITAGSFGTLDPAIMPGSFGTFHLAPMPAASSVLPAAATEFVWHFSVARSEDDSAPYRDTS
jgi:hypothetical protein